MFVRPGVRHDDRALPLIVRAPNGRLLPPSGEDVPETQFWNRRLRDGDVLLADLLRAEPDLGRAIAAGTVDSEETQS
jgi:hypothetical protein